MAVITRENLVLRGASVVLGGMTAWVRPAREYRVVAGTPAFPISMRHPSPSSQDLNQPEPRLNRSHESDADAAVLRAGRSDCFAGVPVRRSSAIRADLVCGRPQNLKTRSANSGGLSLPDAARAGKRPEAMSACPVHAGRTRVAASTRGRGGE